MKKKNFYFFVCMALFFVSQSLQAQVLSANVEKETFVYAVKGTDTLRMDVMRSNKYGNEQQPCVFFMFGGSFARGSRDRIDYLEYFNRLTDEGLTVVSIDYRLLIPEDYKITLLSFLNPFTNPLPVFRNAINAAVEDLYSATSYVLAHHDALQIDEKLVILSGSSAGAITSLTADWNLGRRTAASSVLPTDFTYKGVLSFSGAILSGATGVSYAVPPAPTLFFHGEADSTVPYNQWNFLIGRLVGSATLADSFQARQYPYQFVSIEGGDHELSSTVMTTELDRIVNFIKVFIIGGNTYQLEETI